LREISFLRRKRKRAFSLEDWFYKFGVPARWSVQSDPSNHFQETVSRVGFLFGRWNKSVLSAWFARFVLTCNDVIMWYFRMNFYKNYHEKFLRVKTETLLFILSSITDRFSSVITIRHSIRQRKLYVIEASFWKCFYSMGGFLSVFQARNI
jgi:hypothetical protein